MGSKYILAFTAMCCNMICYRVSVVIVFKLIHTTTAVIVVKLYYTEYLLSCCSK